MTTVLVDEIRLALQFPRKCMDWGGEACGKQNMKKLEKFAEILMSGLKSGNEEFNTDSGYSAMDSFEMRVNSTS